MITLIGFRCTHSNVFSQEVLIDRVFSFRERKFEHRNNLLFEKSYLFANFLEEFVL